MGRKYGPIRANDFDRAKPAVIDRRGGIGDGLENGAAGGMQPGAGAVDRSRHLGGSSHVPADAASQLERLAKLVEDGYMSREEFDRQKRELLGGDDT